MGLGHENLADVEAVGRGVDGAWVGKRVCVEPTLCCEARGIDPPCGPCAAGAFGACENFGAAGAGRYDLPAGTSIGYNARTGGSLGERFVAHRRGLVEVPEGMPDEQAVLTDPAACSLHAVLRCDLSGARRVCVAGAGTLGLLSVACLRAVGFEGQLDLIGRSDYLRPVATRLGADAYLQLPRDEAGAFARVAERTEAEVKTVRFGNRMLAGGYDVVLDCIGTGASFTRCAKWTAGRGQLALVATASRATVDLTPVWFRELTIRGIYGRSLETFAGARIDTYRLVHRLVASGALDLSGLLTHTFGLEDYRAALAAAMNKRAHRAIKVAVDFRNEGST
jgi:threonine dehydrogenase-like Zn-dependent dehydrogenase